MKTAVFGVKPALEPKSGIESGFVHLFSPKEEKSFRDELLESDEEDDQRNEWGVVVQSILSPRRQKMLENVVMILSHKSIKNKKEFLERYAFNKDAIADPATHEEQNR